MGWLCVRPTKQSELKSVENLMRKKHFLTVDDTNIA